MKTKSSCLYLVFLAMLLIGGCSDPRKPIKLEDGSFEDRFFKLKITEIPVELQFCLVEKATNQAGKWDDLKISIYKGQKKIGVLWSQRLTLANSLAIGSTGQKIEGEDARIQNTKEDEYLKIKGNLKEISFESTDLLLRYFFVIDSEYANWLIKNIHLIRK